MSTTIEQDAALLTALSRQIETYERLTERARHDHRAVLLRLSEEHGKSYEELAALAGVGETTVWKSLKRARDDRESAEE